MNQAAMAHAPSERRSTMVRAASIAVAIGCAAAGGFLALHYPIAPTIVGPVFAVLAALAWRHSLARLLVLFALLPILGFAPYTGWISFEETDLLVLAAAAGGYAHLALTRPAAPALHKHGRREISPLVWLLLLLFGTSIVLSTMRGFDDAGGFRFGWFQGYFEPMNGVRLAKSVLFVALLLPLWRVASVEAPDRAPQWLWDGLVLGLAATSLATLWERIAFTGLLNFSTDYRTTALFWEMHVGGGAIDGYLALTVPFALLAWLTARSPQRWGFAAAVLAASAYTCLTTFSRGLYLATFVGVVTTLLLYWRNQWRGASSNAATRLDGHAETAVLLMALFGLAAFWIFPTSGWRGLLALLGLFAVWLPLASSLSRLKASEWGIGLVLGGILSAIAGGASLLISKASYVVFAAAFAATLALTIWRWHRHRVQPRVPTRSAPLLLAGVITVATAMALVALNWGAMPALEAAIPVLAGLCLLTVLVGRVERLAVPPTLRWQTSAMCAALFIAVAVGAFGGGDYMSGRFSTGGKDFENRREHWRQGLAMLVTPADWLLGKGLGRYPANFYVTTIGTNRPGNFHIATEAGNSFLRLQSGNHMMGFLEVMRISQRVSAPALPVQVRAKVLVEREAALRFEVCEKHLLYSNACLNGGMRVKGKAGQWQTIAVPMTGDRPLRGAWYAPALIAFSIGLADPQQAASVDDIELLDGRGRNLLSNGDFSEETAHWFFTSDGFHLPWHVDSIWVNILIEQGVFGLVALALLFVVALFRVTFGAGRDHMLAPALAGGLAGFGACGMVTSLLDVPRVAFLFYFLAMVALFVRARRVV